MAGDFAVAAFESGLPCEDASALEIIIAGYAELRLSAALGRGEALPLALDLTGGRALLVFEDDFDFALARTGGVAPVHGVIMPEPVIALGGSEGPVQAAQFFHPHHRLVGLGGGKVAHEKRIHLELAAVAAGAQAQNQQQAGQMSHGSYSSGGKKKFKLRTKTVREL